MNAPICTNQGEPSTSWCSTPERATAREPHDIHPEGRSLHHIVLFHSRAGHITTLCHVDPCRSEKQQQIAQLHSRAGRILTSCNVGICSRAGHCNTEHCSIPHSRQAHYTTPRCLTTSVWANMVATGPACSRAARRSAGSLGKRSHDAPRKRVGASMTCMSGDAAFSGVSACDSPPRDTCTCHVSIRGHHCISYITGLYAMSAFSNVSKCDMPRRDTCAT